jgi:hypothetical protein
MAAPKKFFQDHIMLLLLSVNAFLALFVAIEILIRINSGRSGAYIVKYHPTVGISAYQTGSVVEILSFIGFGFIVLAVHSVLAIRIYRVNRPTAIAILSLGLLLLLLTIIVSNALLKLH